MTPQQVAESAPAPSPELSARLRGLLPEVKRSLAELLRPAGDA
jgi:hypothetical protein